MFGRRLSTDAIHKAGTVLCTNLTLCVTAVLVIVTATSLDVTDVIFEVASAMGTVGMSAGITRDLDTISKLVLIFLMFCGRVGLMTIITAFARRGRGEASYIEEKVAIG